jgi:Zn-dependent metalloprotease
VYVVDRDLVRFAKFTGAIVAFLLVAGSIVVGFDLKNTEQNTRSIKDKVTNEKYAIKAEIQDVKQFEAQIEESRKEIVARRNEIKAALDDMQQRVRSAKEGEETIRGIVAQVSPGASDIVSLIKITIRTELSQHLAQALPKDQFDRLSDSITRSASIAAAGNKKVYTETEVLQLINSDISRAVIFFKTFGIDAVPPQARIADDKSLMNAYWDGTRIVFGMGMVNSDVFDAYSPTVILHEATHSLFGIKFQGQSSSVAESICDVMAALITRQWSIGSLRTIGDRRQTLRSLSAPGTAYDDPALGKDPQVDHMDALHTGDGDTHINLGILNKAAFLLTEGGTHRNISIRKGLGWEKSAKLYAGVIKKLKPLAGTAVDFAAFRELDVSTDRELFPELDDQVAVIDAFRAVGL